ncbi:hypothetical protein AVEN_209016-1 [Araneus ventricosus]|uniref:Uncharacterized protein n=1 Tax=Araneus ventricosus TaxID=182803 RepID=A0A4Y2DHQ1_ARAVE|nr:hypothetical protein AVEN_209016-1 [Araneus ventricosus]
MARWAANQSAPQVVGGDMVSCRSTLSFSPSSLFKPITFQAKGVAEGLNLSDLPLSRTNHPTTNRHLPSRLIIGSGQNITAPLVGSHCAVYQTIPHCPLRNPSGFA